MNQLKQVEENKIKAQDTFTKPAATLSTITNQTINRPETYQNNSYNQTAFNENKIISQDKQNLSTFKSSGGYIAENNFAQSSISNEQIQRDPFVIPTTFPTNQFSKSQNDFPNQFTGLNDKKPDFGFTNLKNDPTISYPSLNDDPFGNANNFNDFKFEQNLNTNQNNKNDFHAKEFDNWDDF